MDHPLPTKVIATDHRLERATEQSSEELAQHRWHWTLDESNPKRVSIRAYGRAVGRSEHTVRRYAKGYAAWLDQGATDVRRTLTECIERISVGAEKEAAIEAVAEARGVGFRNIRQGAHEDVRAVRTMARERAERRGTTVPEELPQAAQDLVRAEKARKANTASRRERHDMRYIEVEKNLAAAKRALTDAMTAATEVAFTDEERDLLGATIGNVRALIDLIDLRLTGSTDIDWDAELAKMGGQS